MIAETTWRKTSLVDCFVEKNGKPLSNLSAVGKSFLGLVIFVRLVSCISLLTIFAVKDKCLLLYEVKALYTVTSGRNAVLLI